MLEQAPQSEATAQCTQSATPKKVSPAIVQTMKTLTRSASIFNNNWLKSDRNLRICIILERIRLKILVLASKTLIKNGRIIWVLIIGFHKGIKIIFDRLIRILIRLNRRLIVILLLLFMLLRSILILILKWFNHCKIRQITCWSH